MKKLLCAVLLLLSTLSFGTEFEGSVIDILEFEELQNMSVEMEKESVAYPYWQSSSVSCRAYTQCPNGRRIYCQVYGYNYSNIPGHFSNSCRFMVLPGRAVRCQGYSLQRDYYGNAFWSYIDIPVSCY